MGYILKNSKGKEQVFEHDVFFVQGENGELIQFTCGTGDSGGSDVKFFNTSMTLTGTADTRYSVDFGFDPDILLIYPVTEASGNCIHMGTSSKFREKFGEGFGFRAYASSSKIKVSSNTGTLSSESSGQTFHSVDATGFTIGGTHGSGSHFIVAFGF